MQLSGQHFSETPYKTLKFQEKSLLLVTKKYQLTWQRGGVFIYLFIFFYSILSIAWYRE